MATAGLFLAVTLIASGALLLRAPSFIGSEVHTQLAAQQIFFPAANSKYAQLSPRPVRVMIGPPACTGDDRLR